MPRVQKAHLRVRRGLELGMEYAVYQGPNSIDRAGEQPADIDLTEQEPHGVEPSNCTNWSGLWGSPDDPVRCYPQHALIVCDKGTLFIEDLNSPCPTLVNRERVQPGMRCPLKANDLVQIGTVQLEVLLDEVSK